MSLPTKFMLIVCCVSCQARAQIVQNIAVNQVRIMGAGAFGSDEAGLEASMKLEVDAIRRVTGISDSAAKKLEVAAIAAVKNSLKKGANVTANEEQQTSPQPKKDSLSDEDAELKAPKSNPEKKAPRAPQLPAIQVLNADAVRNEEIWTKTLSSVLSAEQSEQYKAFLKERKKRDRDFIVQSVVSQMDAYLLLSEQQRTALIQLVDRVQGDELAAQMQQRAAIGGIGALVVMRAAGQQNSELREDALKEILSPAQVAEHKRQRELAAQGPLVAMGLEQPKPTRKDQVGFATGLGFNVVNESEGLKIQSIDEGEAAEKAGLRIGDIVDSIGEFPVDSVIQLKRALTKIKTPAQIQVRRDGKSIQLELNQ